MFLHITFLLKIEEHKKRKEEKNERFQHVFKNKKLMLVTSHCGRKHRRPVFRKILVHHNYKCGPLTFDNHRITFSFRAV